jgi:uncharacterized membrane protein YgcG
MIRTLKKGMNMQRRIAVLTGILLILGIMPVKAQGGQPPIPPAPPSGSYIVDELDWLMSEQESAINSIVDSLDQDGLAEIAVVTLDDCGQDKLAFRKSLFDTWGIGHADDNDGLLILVCWYGGDTSQRSVEQLYGPGLNRILSASKTDQIAQEHFVPNFQRGDPGGGLVSLVRSYDVLLRKPVSIKTTLISWFEGLDESIKGSSILLLVAALLLLLHRILPHSVLSRLEQFLSERDNNGSDHDSFGGGRSDGGGGSSTRF